MPVLDVSEPAAFARFYDEALPRIYGYFLHRCSGRTVGGRGADSGDVRRGGRPSCARVASVDAPLPWLYGIARHKLLDHYRREATSRNGRRARRSVDDRVAATSASESWMRCEPFRRCSERHSCCGIWRVSPSRSSRRCSAEASRRPSRFSRAAASASGVRTSRRRRERSDRGSTRRLRRRRRPASLRSRRRSARSSSTNWGVPGTGCSAAAERGCCCSQRRSSCSSRVSRRRPTCLSARTTRCGRHRGRSLSSRVRGTASRR